MHCSTLYIFVLQFYKNMLKNNIVSLTLLILSFSILNSQTTGNLIDGSIQTKYLVPPWNFMSLNSTGVDSFLLEHPTFDGRGVVCLIFDTGIDFSKIGLNETSIGKRKIIDAFDFANSNVVKFKKIKSIKNRKGEQNYSADALHIMFKDLPTSIDINECYIGEMNEYNWRNANVRDFNGDNESNSFFGCLLFKVNNVWKVLVDTDADSSIANETQISNFKESNEWFVFKQKNKGKPPMGFVANIDTSNKVVSFVYDAGGHGTHVAGIVSGFGINGEKGFNGVAPGSQLVCCKFSCDSVDDITITGSMKKAFEWAANYSDSMAIKNIPVIVNMSFGIGSALEGRSDIEKFIDDLIPKHKNLFVVTSAGNEGPGISTVGIPSSSSRIITVGALLPKGIARDGYSMTLNQDILWDFSSRGGEVDKPDIVAPGTAVSTIPNHAYESRESGTSMASPNAAGIVALLLSALKQDYPNWFPTQGLIKRALRMSATYMENYILIEQGGGIINVKNAYKLLRKWKESGFADNFQEYTISTESPNYPDGRGSTAFWRSNYFPQDEDRQEFIVVRNSSLLGDTTDFFRVYNLTSTADWLSTIQKNVYIKNNQSAKIDCIYDKDKLKEPGIYCGKIISKRIQYSDNNIYDGFEFELLNTIIVPYKFSPEKDFIVNTPKCKLDPGLSKRFYFSVPSGAIGLKFNLIVDKGSQSNVLGKVINSTGQNVGYIPQAKGNDRFISTSFISTSELGTGIIEIVVNSDAYQGKGDVSEFSLKVESIMLETKISVVKNKLNDEILVIYKNTGTIPLDIDASYTVKGYSKTTYEVVNKDTFSMPLQMRKEDGAIWVSVKFDDLDYMKTTDIITEIIDSNGEIQSKETYNQNEEWMFVPNFTKQNVKLKLRLTIGAANYSTVNHLSLIHI